MTTELLRQRRYQVEQPIGRGAMGTVLLARDTVLHRTVAVKVLAEHLAADDAFRRRFLREARLAARLCHPNIVQVFDACDGDEPFLVMEYVDGETVADRVAGGRGFTADELLALTAQVSAGLAQAHGRGVVHRDVKPHNVLLRRDGMAKLTDFGIARAVEEHGLTEVGAVVGTAAFMAPEQAAGQPVGPAADIYGLGAVLRHAAGGSLPPVLEPLVEAMLATDPAARPTAVEVHRQVTPLSRAAGPVVATGPQAAELPTALTAAGTGPPETALPEAAATETAPTETAPPETPETAPTEIRPAAVPGPTLAAVPTVVRPTEVGPPGAVSDPIGPADEPRRLDAAARRWVAVGAALLLLVVLLPLLTNSNRSDNTTGGSSSVTPVPTGADPAETARNLATWLRDQAG